MTGPMYRAIPEGETPEETWRIMRGQLVQALAVMDASGPSPETLSAVRDHLKSIQRKALILGVNAEWRGIG